MSQIHTYEHVETCDDCGDQQDVARYVNPTMAGDYPNLCPDCLEQAEAQGARFLLFCYECGGTGQYDDVMQCDACEGEGGHDV